ncbi:MAG: hypothetical protein IK990_20180 [Ruminiclostridium sp.]|nr:hypothetical protein [Ruminiclostridium sp.]
MYSRLTSPAAAGIVVCAAAAVCLAEFVRHAAGAAADELNEISSRLAQDIISFH